MFFWKSHCSIKNFAGMLTSLSTVFRKFQIFFDWGISDLNFHRKKYKNREGEFWKRHCDSRDGEWFASSRRIGGHIGGCLRLRVPIMSAGLVVGIHVEVWVFPMRRHTRRQRRVEGRSYHGQNNENDQLQMHFDWFYQVNKMLSKDAETGSRVPNVAEELQYFLTASRLTTKLSKHSGTNHSNSPFHVYCCLFTQFLQPKNNSLRHAG